MKKKTALLALLLSGGLILTACGSGSDPSSSAEFNDADVEFAQEMIAHHEQAVVMASMAEDRAESPEVQELASKIQAAQEPEIDTMQGWLDDWGQDDSAGGMDHGDMGHGSSSEMPGMMDEDQLDDLEGARGGSWDRMFLAMMIEHHEGAIEMAQQEQEDGESPEAIALAAKIVEDQTAEIATMRGLLASS